MNTSNEARLYALEKLSALSYFPTDERKILGILVILDGWFALPRFHRGQRMSSDEQLKLVVDKTIDEGARWGGVEQVRRKLDELFPNMQPWGPDGPLNA